MSSVLVVTTSFAPENAIGSVRMAKFVKYLVRLGIDVTVISPELDEDTSRDETLESPELARIRRYTVGQGRLFRNAVGQGRKKLLASNQAATLISRGDGGLVASVRAAFFRYVRFAYTAFRNRDWERQVSRFCRDSGLVHERFDAILSSYPSLGAMWAAGRMRQSGMARRWIADFRDPVNYETNADPLIYRLNGLIQAKILASADGAVAVSAGVAEKVGRGNPLRPVVLSNGYDPEDGDVLKDPVAEDAASRAFRLAYTGSLYGGARDVSVVFRALKDLIAGGRLDISAVEFHYAGGDSVALTRQAAAWGMEAILVDHGRVPRSEALALQAAADLVVVATWNTEKDQGIMTGKLFECFMMRRPVLGVINGDKAGSEFKQVVERVNGGWVWEAAAEDPTREYERFSAQLARAIDDRHHPAMQYNDSVLDYSYPRLAQALVGILFSEEAAS